MQYLKRTTSDDPDFQQLVALLDADLAIRDGDEHAFYAQFNKTGSLSNVIVCYEGDRAIGCGAFRGYDKEKAEIKRMFVQPEHRGHGVGLIILKELEEWAAEEHYANCILETGIKQPEAIRLYEKAGYTRTKNYGQYLNIENSVCMIKAIL